MTRPSLHFLIHGEHKPSAPLVSWWAEPVEGSFYAKCCAEFTRMKQSREHNRMGDPMVIAQIDGKKARTS